MKCIEVKDVSKFYHEKRHNKNLKILNGINVTVPTGTIYTLVGPSSCGKTTLLTCILGLQKFQNGEIKIFNRKIEFNKTSKFSHLIGYMPQQKSLPSNLTIFETLQYFGNIHLMNQETFYERFEMISKLFELPRKDKLIKELSGGEQRRISLAITIIHNPKLLILDEPTVGVDFEIRDKIWKFLTTQSKETKLTVLITTHYLNETEKADRCGFMKRGVLVAENSPNKIIQHFCVNKLDDAFIEIYSNDKTCFDDADSNKFETFSEEHEDLGINKDKIMIRHQVLKGLLLKEWHRIKRQKIDFVTIFIMSSAILGLVYILLGSFPNDLKVAVVLSENLQKCTINLNDKLSKFELCNNNTKLLCEFLNQMTDVDKIIYENYTEANIDFKHGTIFGFISLGSNFISSLIENNTKNIEIHIDSSKIFFKDFVNYKIFSTLEIFTKILKERCDINTNSMLPYMQVTDLQEISLNFDLSKFITINMLAMAAFITPMIYSGLIIYECRSEGIWERTYLSGVKVIEIITAYIIQCIFVSLLVTVEIFIFLIYVLNVDVLSHQFLIIFILFELATLGYLSGFLTSIFFKTLVGISGFCMGIIMIQFMASGIMWPLETAMIYIYPISYSSPLTLSRQLFQRYKAKILQSAPKGLSEHLKRVVQLVKSHLSSFHIDTEKDVILYSNDGAALMKKFGFLMNLPLHFSTSKNCNRLTLKRHKRHD
ncbi:hypothetical protein PVAND_004198 [Polypedilum vanderplanki]|uniref:ABC transporter domain-containing protein n=1 Tax=Polypedilum vanderplanki TaxID=319348 RepID=A0A9J6BWV1_POLVA|nr:hypothetical protein PVAND_004198 [Polypedilum vanderplanki]